MITDYCLLAAMALGLCTLLGAEIVKAGPAVDLVNHNPHFRWKTGPNGEKWIYDGDMPVAAFYAGTEPLGSIARPISLHNAKLIPEGPLFIAQGEGCGPICLSWRKHLIFQMKIDELKVDDTEPQRFKLYVKSHDVALRKDQPYQAAYRPNNVVEESWLEVIYDPHCPATCMTSEPR